MVHHQHDFIIEVNLLAYHLDSAPKCHPAFFGVRAHDNRHRVIEGISLARGLAGLCRGAKPSGLGVGVGATLAFPFIGPSDAEVSPY